MQVLVIPTGSYSLTAKARLLSWATASSGTHRIVMPEGDLLTPVGDVCAFTHGPSV